MAVKRAGLAAEAACLCAKRETWQCGARLAHEGVPGNWRRGKCKCKWVKEAERRGCGRRGKKAGELCGFKSVGKASDGGQFLRRRPTRRAVAGNYSSARRADDANTGTGTSRAM